MENWVLMKAGEHSEHAISIKARWLFKKKLVIDFVALLKDNGKTENE